MWRPRDGYAIATPEAQKQDTFQDRGQIFKSHGAWFLRFYEAGKRVTHRLASIEEYPTQRSVEPLAQTVFHCCWGE